MKKVIICSVSIGLVLVLGVAALILALIPVNRNSIIEKPNAIYIINDTTWDNSIDISKAYVLQDYRENIEGEKTDVKKIDEIFRLFNTGFGQNALTALFKGELNDRMTSEHRDSSNTGSMTKNTTSTTAFSVFFYYRDTKTMILEDEEFQYNWLFFEVTENDEFSYKVFGVRNHTSTTSDFLTSSSSPITFSYNYNAKANFNGLYDYLLELVDNVYRNFWYVNLLRI